MKAALPSLHKYFQTPWWMYFPKKIVALHPEFAKLNFL